VILAMGMIKKVTSVFPTTPEKMDELNRKQIECMLVLLRNRYKEGDIREALRIFLSEDETKAKEC
jgi:Trp operon repressor